jgi:MinD-like ATPase involved in chromosome partitioning or flagellar assembly
MQAAKEALVPPDAQLDQATGLRRLLGESAGTRAVGVFSPDPGLKATATMNLARAMSLRGNQAWIFDESDEDALTARYGLSPATGTDRQPAQPLDSALRSGPEGVRLLPCGRNSESMRAWDTGAWSRLAKESPQPDWLFLAAPEDERSCLAHAAPARVLAVSGHRNHLTEAYALLKSAHRLQPECRWWILLMDLANASRGQPLMQAIIDTSRRFLEITPGHLGNIPLDEKLHLANRALRPVLDFAPGSASAAAFRGTAETLARAEPALGGAELQEFWMRMGIMGGKFTQTPRPKQEYARGRLYG